MTLVILAAGMGSRYGGLKQLDPMTKHGEFIIDFSVFDAKDAGIDRVIFIIKQEHEQLFKQTIGDRISEHIDVEYVYQSLDNLPQGFDVPDGREKPWGTVHALLCAEKAVGSDSIMVINADDFYGRHSYEVVARFLKDADKKRAEFCMPGYLLKNTLTENGSVSRGICEVDANRMLIKMNERTKIFRNSDNKIVYEEDGEIFEVDENLYSSMNFWGFTPQIFPLLKHEFVEFLGSEQGDIFTKELCLSTCIDNAVAKGNCTVEVLPTQTRWYGVTYREDKEYVVSSIQSMIDNGMYPDRLFRQPIEATAAK